MKKLTLFLILSILIFSTVVGNSAELQSYVTHYRLDTGVIFVWKNSAGVWQDGEPGKNYTSGYTLDLARNINPSDIYDVCVYPYSLDSYYFESENFLWFPTLYATNKEEYNLNYYLTASNNIKNVVANYNNQTGSLQVIYTADLLPVETLFNVKQTLNTTNGEQIIYNYMGLTPETAPADLKAALEEVKTFHPNVEGYLYFVPTIIEYKVKKTIDIEAMNAIRYLFSTFNDYTINRTANTKNHTFWMLAPEYPTGVTDEFLVEVRSHVINTDTGILERRVNPITHIEFNENQVVQTVNFIADGTPIDATIWRKGIERADISEVFKQQFFRGYTKEHNGETYYFYQYYQSAADGEMYPIKKAFEKVPSANTQSFIGRYGFTNIDDYEYRVLNP